MNSSSLSAARTPFIRLLVPLLAGILYQEFLCLPIWGNLIPALCGLVLWSSFIKRDSIEEQYHKRSIFGVGLFLIVFSIGAILHGTQNRISQQPSGFLSYRDSSRKRQSRRKNELLLLSRYDNSPIGYKRVDREI